MNHKPSDQPDKISRVAMQIFQSKHSSSKFLHILIKWSIRNRSLLFLAGP